MLARLRCERPECIGNGEKGRGEESRSETEFVQPYIWRPFLIQVPDLRKLTKMGDHSRVFNSSNIINDFGLLENSHGG